MSSRVLSVTWSEAGIAPELMVDAFGVEALLVAVLDACFEEPGGRERALRALREESLGPSR